MSKGHERILSSSSTTTTRLVLTKSKEWEILFIVFIGMGSVSSNQTTARRLVVGQHFKLPFFWAIFTTCNVPQKFNGKGLCSLLPRCLTLLGFNIN